MLSAQTTTQIAGAEKSYYATRLPNPPLRGSWVILCILCALPPAVGVPH